jgi:hypothetical protein
MTIHDVREASKSRKSTKKLAAALGEKHFELTAKNLPEFEFLTLCQLLYRRNVGGAVTPCEDFLLTLLRRYGYYPLTPEDITVDLEDFKYQHETLIKGAKNALREYPEAFKEVAVA